MTPTEQPEALILADKLEREARVSPRIFVADERKEAAAELRRLHAENEALRERADFLTGMTREAQHFAHLYGDEVLTLRAAREADREAMRMARKALEVATTPFAKDRREVLAAISALEQRVG